MYDKASSNKVNNKIWMGLIKISLLPITIFLIIYVQNIKRKNYKYWIWK